MPKDNIERAIAKGTGEGADADALEDVVYEGYGPGGVAMLVEAVTDNRNRTGSEVRHLFSKHGGCLGEPGSVAYLFDKKGLVVVDGERYTEDDLMVAIDAGAEDIAHRRRRLRGPVRAADLTAVRAALEAAGIDIETAEVTQRPKSNVPLDEDGATKLLKLIDALEDQDDVDTVHANFDVDADVLERVMARRSSCRAMRRRRQAQSVFERRGDRRQSAPLDRDRRDPHGPCDLPAAVPRAARSRGGRAAPSSSDSLNHAPRSDAVGDLAKLCGWWISPGE